MTNSDYDAVVIGGSGAGLSAALMLGRSGRRTLVLDSGAPRNRFAHRMHGVLGHDGEEVPEFLRRGRAELAGYGVDVVTDAVVDVVDGDDGLTIECEGRGTVRARAVLLASGMSDVLPDVAGLAQCWGTSLLHCPYCHGWEVRGKRLGVFLSSPMSLHQVELVRQLSDDVVVFASGSERMDASARVRLGSRGVVVEDAAVVGVTAAGGQLSAVHLADGRDVTLDAIFAIPQARPNDAVVAGLELARSETPFGSVIAVGALGKTSNPRVWAAGNVVFPGANVTMAMAAGGTAGAAINADLAAREFDAAVTAVAQEPARFWDERYAGSEKVWSGHVNDSLRDAVADLEPGTALDLGCGEGGDAIWLAERGWRATGVDISPTAITRSAHAAADAGVASRARFLAADLADWSENQTYDLVTASFLQSPVHLSRTQILRRAAERVRPGGHLLVIAHGPSDDAHHRHGDDDHAGGTTHVPIDPREEVEDLGLDPDAWQVRRCELVPRMASIDGGEPIAVNDSVVLFQLTANGAR